MNIMDFIKLKKEALKLKDKAQEVWKKAVVYWAEKLADSSAVIKKKKEFDALIASSQNTSHTTESGEKKTFSHRSIALVIDVNSDFFKSMLLSFPVLQTKAFSQSIKIKMLDSKAEWINLEVYNVDEIPSLIVFENEKKIKVISGQEKVENLVKSLNLDINKEIDEM